MIDINLLPKTAKPPINSKYLRFATAAFVAIALLSIGSLQVWSSLQQRQLKVQKNDLALEFRDLQHILDEQNALLQRQTSLRQLLNVRDEVKKGTITWSQELAFMLETLPPSTGTGRPSIAFSNLAIRALGDNNRSTATNAAAYEEPFSYC